MAVDELVAFLEGGRTSGTYRESQIKASGACSARDVVETSEGGLIGSRRDGRKI